MNIKELSVSKGTIYRINPSDIVIEDGFNCRQDYGDIKELANSIVESGLKNPLRGYLKDGKFVVIDGHRRLKAINYAIKNGSDFKAVDCINDGKSNEETRLFDQLTCNSGKAFTPIEQSEVINRLSNLGWKQKDIAKKLGKTQAFVSQSLKIHSLPQKAKSLIHEGAMAVSFALQILNDCNGDEKTFSDKLDEVKNHFEETGQKVTNKKSGIIKKEEKEEGNEEVKVISEESGDEVGTEENGFLNQESNVPDQAEGKKEEKQEKQEGFYTDLKEEQEEGSHTDPEEEQEDELEDTEGFDIEDYKLILADAKEMIMELASLVQDDKMQENSANLVARIEQYC